jgi:hypothetical protein
VAAVLPAKQLRLSQIVANYKKNCLFIAKGQQLFCLHAASSEAAKVKAVPELI